MAVQLLLCRVLSPGLVQYCLQHSCVIAVKLFLYTLSVHVVHPYSSIKTTAAWKKSRFILLVNTNIVVAGFYCYNHGSHERVVCTVSHSATCNITSPTQHHLNIIRCYIIQVQDGASCFKYDNSFSDCNIAHSSHHRNQKER